MSVKVRMAPSPTGNLHVGTAQSALFNWLYARKNKGEFHLRIEDTDKERSESKYVDDIISGLDWLGIKTDGNPVFQSTRTGLYLAHLESLLKSGTAFWCDHSKVELELEQTNQKNNKEAPRHICDHKDKNLSSGQVIRLRVIDDNDEDVSFEDEIRGRVSFKKNLLGDFSIAKSISEPLYNFAVVVDDMEMGITHVIRGEDHISNTPKQILIYRAFKSTIPKFAHLPLLLGQDRSKLSKRHGATSLNEYNKDYLPEALINFLATLSHTYSKEILTRDELIEEFDLKKVHKSGAVFDVKKLNWMNAQYIKKLSPEEFKKAVGNENIPDAAVPLITERLEKLTDVNEFNYLWQEPEYDTKMLKWKKSSLEEVKSALEKVKNELLNSDFSKEDLKDKLDRLGEEMRDRGIVYWPLRVALTGKEKSPDPIDIAAVLGKKEVLKRIDKALSKI